MFDTGKTVPPSELFLFGNSSSSGRHSPAGIHARGLHTRFPRGLDANQEAGERRVSCMCVHVRVCAGVYIGVSVHPVPACVHAGVCVHRGVRGCVGLCACVCVCHACDTCTYTQVHIKACKGRSRAGLRVCVCRRDGMKADTCISGLGCGENVLWG